MAEILKRSFKPLFPLGSSYRNSKSCEWVSKIASIFKNGDYDYGNNKSNDDYSNDCEEDNRINNVAIDLGIQLDYSNKVHMSVQKWN